MLNHSDTNYRTSKQSKKLRMSLSIEQYRRLRDTGDLERVKLYNKSKSWVSSPHNIAGIYQEIGYQYPNLGCAGCTDNMLNDMFREITKYEENATA